MVRKKHYLYSCLLLVLTIILVTPVYAAKINVDMDRTIVEEGESFVVEFSSSDGVDDDPDFSVLKKNFRILSNRQSSNIQFINGKMTSKKAWLLTLMPKRVGKLTIPAVSFGSDSSRATTLTVKKPSKTKNKGAELLFMEVEVEPKNVYIQSQLITTIRIYHAVNLANASLSELKISDNNAMMEKLGDDVSYDKNINGYRYKVFEKRVAIFPQQSGRLIIEPVEFEGQYVNRRRMLQSKLLKSKKIIVNVKPQPNVQSKSKQDKWLPAENLKIEEKWSAELSTIKVGEPITRTITILADGLLGSQLPELASINSTRIKQYPDQPQVTTRKGKNGVVGIRQEKIAFIPTKHGKITLPALEIPWWNTRKNQQEIALIKSYVIDVGKKTVSDYDGQQDGSDNSTLSGELSTELLAGNKVPLLSDSTPFVQVLMRILTANIWFWVSLILLVLWVVTTILWFRNKQVHRIDKSRQAVIKNDKLSVIEKRIKHACNLHQTEQAKDLLVDWSNNVWTDDVVNNLSKMRENCDPILRNEIQQLSNYLYAQDKQSNKQKWNGRKLWEAFSECKSSMLQKAEKTQKTTDSLEPLYYHS